MISVGTEAISVMVSSTVLDMQGDRDAVVKILNSSSCFRTVGAPPAPQMAYSGSPFLHTTDIAGKCALYILLLGGRGQVWLRGWAYMDFAGNRGIAALNSPIREMCLPDIQGKPVAAVVIAKAVLATGCTAISLTRTAMSQFVPQVLVIATIYYSLEGVEELRRAFPNAAIVLIGEGQLKKDDDFLIPGIGLLDANVH